MRLKADRVEVKKETVIADNADSMKEEIETKAEVLVIYTLPLPLRGLLGLGLLGPACIWARATRWARRA